MAKFVQKVFYLFFVLILAGCSGNDDAGDPTPSEPKEPTVMTGIFVDSEVAGLNYSTETQSGITNSQGEYNYLEGETVTFTVGDIVLGSGPAGPEMTPLNIASTANATLETDEVQNIAAFLQTLDSDGDASNGILIESATVEAISVSSIDFTQPIVSILGEIVAEVNLANDTNLSVVYPEDATAHLADSLGETYNKKETVYSNFIPFLENWYGKSLNSYYWIHETDEDGDLITSYQYEMYPNRLAYKIVYSHSNEMGQPLQFDEILYDRISGEEVRKFTIEITYSEEGLPLSSISTGTSPDGEYYLHVWFTKLNEEMRVVEFALSRTPDTDPTERYELVYDEEGNQIESTKFNMQTGAQSRKVIYTYTEWGDIESETLIISGKEVGKYERFYRIDRTLREVVSTGPYGTQSTLYDEDEMPINS